MSKAFLFDMDGVLADTESLWDSLGFDELLVDYFGKELTSKVKISSGLSFKSIFDEFQKHGWQGSYQDFHALNQTIANKIYPVVQLTPGLDDLILQLDQAGFKLGVVSSSPMEWIQAVTKRIKNQALFDLILSVNVHKTLKPKPAPDPYLYAMRKLNVLPQDTYILEDSIAGVTSGKTAGAKVICFTAYIHPELNNWQVISEGADYYASSMEEVGRIVAKIG